MHSVELAAAATGRVPCDLNIVNCVLVDVFQGRIVPDSTVSISRGVIVGVNDGLRAENTFDAKGRFLAPGFMDAHVHIESSLLSPSQYARIVVPRGTTSVAADPHEIVNVLGYDGMNYMLRSSENLPLDVYLTVPSCVPATHFDSAGAALFASDMHQFAREDRVLGLGEVMNFPGVLTAETTLMDKIALFKGSGKIIEGHSPGLRGRDLSAYIAAGIFSDHEATDAEEAAEKVSKGMWVMIREGSAARDLAALVKAVTPANARRFLLCSDDRHPTDLMREGHIDRMLRLLVERGIDPIDAIRMATINPAERFGLRSSGAIAPGFAADIVLVEDLKEFNVTAVFKRGKSVAENGKLVAEIENRPSALRDSVNIKWLEESDFRIKREGRRARVIEAREGSLITGERLEEPAMGTDGYCASDTERDILRIYVIERHKGSGNIGHGFIHGLGLKRGAIASTISHDSHNLIVVGVDDKSIFRAAKHLNKIGGGLVATIGNEIILELPLPIAGLMSDRPAEETIESLDAFERFFKSEGISNTQPLMTLSFMALPVIPHLKITDRGLVDVDRFERVPLFAD
ncbi:MAG: adenine deaminase [Treponemataceae bacterium]